MFPYGLSSAATIRVGNLLGAQNPKAAKRTTQVTLTLVALSMIVNSIFILSCGRQIGVWFSPETLVEKVSDTVAGGSSNATSAIFDAGILIDITDSTESKIEVFKSSEVRNGTEHESIESLVAAITPITALYQLLDGTQTVSGGILRGCGQQSYAATVTLSAYYLVGIPVALSLAFPAKLGVVGLWWGICVAITILAILMIGKVLFWIDWDVEVQNASKRVSNHE
jgi:Na+-driven multidrug efflux pump